jgi:outer membrane protein
MRGVWTYLWAVTGVAVAAAGIGSRQAAADTLEWALVQAYQNNPSLNAQRAALRATDENVPQALSGYRPKLSVTASGGAEYQKSASQIPVGTGVVNSTAAQTFYPRIVLLFSKKLS